MTTLNEYSQFAAAVYAKQPNNELPIPTGWTPLLSQIDQTSGFSAGELAPVWRTA
jgi:hypothetical protein